MAPFYQALCEDLKWQVDNNFLQKMQTANESRLKQLDERIKVLFNFMSKRGIIYFRLVFF